MAHRTPQFCDQKFHNMEPVAGSPGRHCSECSRTVVDFSKMNWTEISRFHLETDFAYCGAFSKVQTENWMQPIPEKSSKLKTAVITSGLLLALSQLYSSKAKGQTVETQEHLLPEQPCTEMQLWENIEEPENLLAESEPIPSEQTDSLESGEEFTETKASSSIGTLTIHGKITDIESGEPLPFVNIYFEGTQIGVCSDFDGNYLLEVEAAQLSDTTTTLKAYTLGYEPVLVKIDPKQLEAINSVLDIEIELAAVSVFLGGAIVAVEQTPTRIITYPFRWSWFKIRTLSGY